jgi:hypothetical protein
MQAVFLLCSERSGSNLITRMVDNHPQFCAPSPTHLIRLLVQHREAYQDWDDLCADAAELLATKLGEWRTQPSAPDLRALPVRTLPELLRHVFEAEARACGKERLFIKENHAARFLPFLLEAWPDAQFVHLVRDPRDMALSWKRSAVHRGDVVRAARVWQQDQAEAVAAIARLRIHSLTYEDLVVVPELELLRLCRFLGVRFLPAMLAYHRDPVTIAAAGRTSAWENLAQPVMVANTGKWREGLDNTEVALVESVCAREMSHFGYACTSTDPRCLRELEAELLPFERQDKPAYRDLPAAERALRARRELLERRLAAREAQLSPSR